MRQLKIEVKGEGTKSEIAYALLSIVNSLLDPTQDIDEQAGAGIEWEDKTLMTNINPA